MIASEVCACVKGCANLVTVGCALCLHVELEDVSTGRDHARSWTDLCPSASLSAVVLNKHGCC